MLFKFKLQLRGGATSTSRVVWSSQASYEPEACISGYIYVLASPSAVNLNPGQARGRGQVNRGRKPSVAAPPRPFGYL
jgi:hypothetical protein